MFAAVFLWGWGHPSQVGPHASLTTNLDNPSTLLYDALMTEPIIEALSWFIGIVGICGSVGLCFLAMLFMDDDKTKRLIVTVIAAIILLASTASSISYLQAIKPVGMLR